MDDHKQWMKNTRKLAKKMGVSAEFIRSQPHWIQEGRAPTAEEFQHWARNQHKRACKEYVPQQPLSKYNGQCHHMRLMHKPCVAFFSHTGICETGFFEPDRMHHLILKGGKQFDKSARKAARQVKKEVH